MDPKTIEQLQAENAALLAENATLKKVVELEPAVKAKMEAGLTREQAESVVKQQVEHDKALAEIEATQAKARKDAAKK
jgi:hypothetical protein